MKHIYYYDEYYKDVSSLADRYAKIKNPHVVSVYKDSLPFGVQISNLLNCGMSIISSENGKAEWILNNTENVDIRPEGTKQFFPYLICIDTVYREEVFTPIKEMPEFINNPDYTFYTFFGHDNNLGVHYTHEMIYKDVDFPWQRLIGSSDLVL